jgi:CDGSH-type Zn-finger protein
MHVEREDELMSDKPRPEIAACRPISVELEPGEYWWCQCGKSQDQPFCDGSHRAERIFSPKKIELDRTRTVKLCVCKQTSTPPYCDQTHIRLKECID